MEIYVIDDVWSYIKTFLFHNIKIHGKHLKPDKDIQRYNKIIQKFPTLLRVIESSRKVTYSSATLYYRYVKFVYELKYKNIRYNIISMQKYTSTNDNFYM
jgi:hypothetical protein